MVIKPLIDSLTTSLLGNISKKWYAGLFFAALLGIAAIPEADWLDYRFLTRDTLVPSKRADERIAIVALDETFALSQKNPGVVPRRYLAQLIDSLSSYGAKVIALNYALTVSDREQISAYAQLQQSIKSAGNVVLPSYLNANLTEPLLLPVPPAEIREYTLTGYAEFESERPQNATLYVPFEGGLLEPSFALATALAYQRLTLCEKSEPLYLSDKKFGISFHSSVKEMKEYLSKLQLDFTSNSLAINYIGSVGNRHFNTYYAERDIVSPLQPGSFPKSWLKDKLVLVGSIYSLETGRDEFITPYGKMQGIEVHANILNNILQHSFLTVLPKGLEVVIIFLALILPLLFIAIYSVQKGFRITLLFLITYVFFSYLTFISFQWLLPISLVIKCSLIGFCAMYSYYLFKPMLTQKREYLDFKILLQNGNIEGKHQAILLQSPARGAGTTESFRNSLTKNTKTALQKLSEGDIEKNNLIELGTALFNIAFIGKIETYFFEALQKARSQFKGLNIQLKVDSKELRHLPWEYIYNAHSNAFMSSSPETIFSRLLLQNTLPQQKLMVQNIRVLIILSAPSKSSAAALGLIDLDIEFEKHLILRALQELKTHYDKQVEYQILEHAVAEDIQKKLEEGYEIIHFIGHSGFQENNGLIVLEDNSHKANYKTDQYFANLFSGYPTIKLFVLNSCKSANMPSQTRVSGLASYLLANGIPAVIGMQNTISDKTAICFSEHFYKNLAIGLPIDVAMNKTRHAIMQHASDSIIHEFGIPVLYLNR